MSTIAKTVARRRMAARGVAVAMVLLALALGFCLFDDDGDHHQVPRDLCLGLLVAVLMVTLIETLPLAGTAAIPDAAHVPSPLARVLAPPPRVLPVSSS